jgi:hypothetical protein
VITTSVFKDMPSLLKFYFFTDQIDGTYFFHQFNDEDNY